MNFENVPAAYNPEKDGEVSLCVYGFTPQLRWAFAFFFAWLFQTTVSIGFVNVSFVFTRKDPTP